MLTTTSHPEYNYWKPVWTMVDDFILGEKQVKSKAETYLPTSSHWTAQQYRELLEMAPFTNFTSRTVNALIGAMFMNQPLVTLPPHVEYLLENADGRGNSLLQVMRRIAHEVVKKGRVGVYVDYPSIDIEDGARTITAEQAKGKQASLVTYDALSILDWEEDSMGLTYVLLQEEYRNRDSNLNGIFMPQVRHRELYLENGVYKVRVTEGSEAIVKEYTPLINNQTMDYIPFFFAGALNNDAECDTPPVYEIVSKNKTHYILEADIMKNIRLMNSPFLTLSIGDISPQQFLQINGLDENTPLTFGVSRGLILGAGGKGEILQAQANDMAQSKAKDVLQEAIMLGARLVVKSQASRITAEQIRIESSAENSVITAIANNIEMTILRAINTAQMFMAQRIEPATVSMNTEVYAQGADAQILMFARQMMADSAGVFSPRDMFLMLKNSGLIDSSRTFEEVQMDSFKHLSTIITEPAVLDDAAGENDLPKTAILESDELVNGEDVVNA